MSKRSTPIVWILKEQVRRGLTGSEAMDYTPAMRWGEIKFVTDFDVPLHPGGTVMGKWAHQVRQFVEQFDPAIDFIVPTGQPVAMVLIGYILGATAKLDGGIQFLVWRREENTYIPFVPSL